MKNWILLVRERFLPAVTVPLIALFVAINGAYAQRVFEVPISSGSYLIVFLVALSFFFRLRLFDDIKDYEWDLIHNPMRPLTKGILNIHQAKRVIGLLILFELAVTFNLGFWPFIIHLTALFFSLLTYEEFFIGNFLKPRLLLYMFSHTFVVPLLALSIGTSITNLHFETANSFHLAFFCVSWSLFNFLEIVRKTYAPEEEKPGAQTYSALYTHIGAVVLAISQFFLSALFWFYSQNVSFLNNFDLMSALYLLVLVLHLALGAYYVLRPTRHTAKIYRSGSVLFVFLICLLLLLTLQ